MLCSGYNCLSPEESRSNQLGRGPHRPQHNFKSPGIGKGQAIVPSETRAVSNFDTIVLSHMGEMNIVQGEPEAIVVEADQATLPRIITEVRNGALVIDVGRSWWERLLTGFMHWGKDVRYTVTLRQLRGLRVDGASNVHADSLDTRELAIRTSGASTVTIDHLTAQRLDVAVSGRGEYHIAGSVQAQHVDVSGYADFRAGNLNSEIAEIKVSGNSNATVRVSNSLNITISGIGSVEYYGDPQVSQSITGVGEVRRLGQMQAQASPNG